LREIYSTKQSKWFYDAGIEQMISLPLPVYLGASVYKLTDSNSIDKEIIESSENSLAAYFLNEDYRDYFTREGTSLHARLKIPSAGEIGFKYLDDEYSSLERKTNWSLFGGDKHFRLNPLIDDGDMKSYIISYTLDKRSNIRCLTSGPWIRLSMERAGYDFGGDFEFTTLFLDARNYVKLGPSQFIRYRLMAGSRTEGSLPLQKEFYVGGIGTLRGHDYKELTGDQMMLGNIEYGVNAGRTVGMFMFVDSGKAWYGDGDFMDQRLELDAGVGIELLCQQTQIYAAKDLKDSDAPILVGLRLNRTF
jgi:outer membrane protein assembly factor BamA